MTEGCRYNEFGAIQLCNCGAEILCAECTEQLHDGDEATPAYIGSGEDAPAAWKKAKHVKKEEVLEL